MTTRRYTNPHLPYLTLPYLFVCCVQIGLLTYILTYSISWARWAKTMLTSTGWERIRVDGSFCNVISTTTVTIRWNTPECCSASLQSPSTAFLLLASAEMLTQRFIIKSRFIVHWYYKLCSSSKMLMKVESSKVERPTKHIIGHINEGFYGSSDPTKSVKAIALKENRFLRIRFQSHQVHPTMLWLTNMQYEKKQNTVQRNW